MLIKLTYFPEEVKRGLFWSIRLPTNIDRRRTDKHTILLLQRHNDSINGFIVHAKGNEFAYFLLRMAQQARMPIPDRYFQPSRMFVGEAGILP